MPIQNEGYVMEKTEKRMHAVVWIWIYMIRKSFPIKITGKVAKSSLRLVSFS